MRERSLSMRQLAHRVGVAQSHISRVVSGSSRKPASGALAERLAAALELPSDYFPEARRARLIARIDADGALRDRLYDRLAKSTRRAR
jgi:transcriptional regulator with XRE-family HTH domain